MTNFDIWKNLGLWKQIKPMPFILEAAARFYDAIADTFGCEACPLYSEHCAYYEQDTCIAMLKEWLEDKR